MIACHFFRSPFQKSEFDAVGRKQRDGNSMILVLHGITAVFIEKRPLESVNALKSRIHGGIDDSGLFIPQPQRGVAQPQLTNII